MWGPGAEKVKDWAFQAPPVGLSLGITRPSKGSVAHLIQAPVQQIIYPTFVQAAATVPAASVSRTQVAPAPLAAAAEPSHAPRITGGATAALPISVPSAAPSGVSAGYMAGLAAPPAAAAPSSAGYPPALAVAADAAAPDEVETLSQACLPRNREALRAIFRRAPTSLRPRYSAPARGTRTDGIPSSPVSGPNERSRTFGAEA